MDNLLNIGISEKTIDKMIEENDYLTIENLDYNYENVRNVIDLLKYYEMDNIDELLINYTDLFAINIREIKKVLSRYKEEELKKVVKQDKFLLIEMIYCG